MFWILDWWVSIGNTKGVTEISSDTLGFSSTVTTSSIANNFVCNLGLQRAWSLITWWGCVSLCLARYYIFFIFYRSNSVGSTLIMSRNEWTSCFDSWQGPSNFSIKLILPILILPICFVKLGLGQFLQIHYNFKCNWSLLKAVLPPFGSPTKTHQWTPTIQQIPCGFLTVNFTQGSIRKQKQFTRMLCEPQLNSIHLIGLLVYRNTQNCLENLHKAFSS